MNEPTNPSEQPVAHALTQQDSIRLMDEIFYKNPLPMWIFDTDTLAFLEVNRAATVRYGYSRQELLGMTIADIRAPEDVAGLRNAFQNGHTDGVDTGEWRHQFKDGTLVDVRVVSHRVIFNKKSARFVTVLDISAPKPAENALHDALDRAKRQTTQLQHVSQLAQRLNVAAGPQQLLQEISDAAQAIIGAHQSVISFTLDQNWSQSINAVSLSDKYAQYRNYNALPDGSGIYSIVCKTNQPMRLRQEELIAHPAWKNFGAEINNHPPLNGWVAAPLVSRTGNNIGLIQLSDKISGEFSQDDEAILVQLAHMVSNMLDNQRLYETLQETEERFRQMAENVQDLFWIQDANTSRLLYLNPAFERFYGINSQTSDPAQDEPGENTAPTEQHWIIGSVQSESASVPGEEIIQALRTDGETRSLLVRKFPIYNEAGDIYRQVSVATDITDQLTAQAAAEEAQRIAETLYRISRKIATLNKVHEVTNVVIDEACSMLGVPMGIFITINEDKDKIQAMQFATKGLTELAQSMLPEDGRGGPFAQLVIMQQRTLCIADITHLDDFAGSPLGVMVASGELKLRSLLAVPVIADCGKSLGGLFFGSATAAHFDLRHEQLAEGVAASAGVTLEKLILQEEIKKYASNLEQHVAERTAQLERANAELESFSYSVSHDLRAPLRAIDGFSQILHQQYGDVLDDSGRHYLQRIRAGTQRMGQLIDDLLELSRVTRADLQKAPVNLSLLAQSIVTELQQSEPDRTVKVDIEDGLRARGDENLCRIVVRNLLDNAWKFTGKTPNPVIQFVRKKLPDGREAFCVIDNGVGFDMSYREKLFGVFQRLHRAAEFPGTGVGLATVQRIVHRHGGEIWADSVPGKGSTFYYTLPLPDMPSDI